MKTAAVSISIFSARFPRRSFIQSLRNGKKKFKRVMSYARSKFTDPVTRDPESRLHMQSLYPRIALFSHIPGSYQPLSPFSSLSLSRIIQRGVALCIQSLYHIHTHVGHAYVPTEGFIDCQHVGDSRCAKQRSRTKKKAILRVNRIFRKSRFAEVAAALSIYTHCTGIHNSGEHVRRNEHSV